MKIVINKIISITHTDIKFQDSNQSNVDNLNNVRREASRCFRNKKKEYLQAKVMNLKLTVTPRISNFCRGISDFKKGYQPRTNVVKDEKCDVVTGSHSIFAKWRNHFSHILNVHGVDDVQQTEIQTAAQLVPEPSTFEVEMAIKN